MKHEQSQIAVQARLNSVALCHRSYNVGTRSEHEIFTVGETYSCRSYCDGTVEVEDNSGVLPYRGVRNRCPRP